MQLIPFGWFSSPPGCRRSMFGYTHFFKRTVDVVLRVNVHSSFFNFAKKKMFTQTYCVKNSIVQNLSYILMHFVYQKKVGLCDNSDMTILANLV